MKPKIFSAIPGLGRVYQCPSCDDIHLSVGPVDLRLSQESFKGVMELIQKAAGQMREDESTISIARGVSWNASRWNLC